MEILPQELAEKLKTEKPPHLVDVREAQEFALVAIEGAQLIPLGELRARVDEIPNDRELVVYCHHGMRSLQGVAVLAQAGREALSLKGGIDAWSRQVDPALPRY